MSDVILTDRHTHVLAASTSFAGKVRRLECCPFSSLPIMAAQTWRLLGAQVIRTRVKQRHKHQRAPLIFAHPTLGVVHCTISADEQVMAPSPRWYLHAANLCGHKATWCQEGLRSSTPRPRWTHLALCNSTLRVAAAISSIPNSHCL